MPSGQNPKLEALLSINKSFLRTIPAAHPGAQAQDPLSILTKEVLDAWFRTIDLIVELVLIFKPPRLRNSLVGFACIEYWALISACTKSNTTALDYVDILKAACEKNSRGR